jgi:hypothetical protein
MKLAIGDMVTKRIVFDEEQERLMILGRKQLHFIDLRTMST